MDVAPWCKSEGSFLGLHAMGVAVTPWSVSPCCLGRCLSLCVARGVSRTSHSGVVCLPEAQGSPSSQTSLTAGYTQAAGRLLPAVVVLVPDPAALSVPSLNPESPSSSRGGRVTVYGVAPRELTELLPRHFPDSPALMTFTHGEAFTGKHQVQV